ncbi:hypothetical protein BELL_0021g00330 [Botrytis elliptica]|uniref:Gfd2/YDR514C-like C-terminal domain-containing protein n=1 Tax=Botrytis elliptica TaxID=278938 RepID=A0A4Z1K156_9HELO|nr:hypothetical protein EAE99_000362 [Botrytis elliptica]TGO79859.1 hypothetical protein BELL_0021g00330 [Botrytis elliptica]
MTSHLKDLNILQTGSCKSSEAHCQSCWEDKVIHILQQNFGFPSKVASQPPQCSCEFFRAGSPAASEDCIIVSMDLEISKEQTQLNEIGICMLDTRDLQNFKQKPTPDTNKLLSTYSFGLHRYKTISKRFRYGEAEYMEEHKVKDLLHRVLRTGNPFPQSTEIRQVILIANGIFHDLFNLRKMGFMPDLSKFPNIMVVDICNLFRRLIKEEMRARLWVILKFFHIPYCYDSLHHGGNDANLTLKALIMLTLESCKNFSWSPEQNQNRPLLLLVAREAAPLAEWQLRKTTKEATIAKKKAFRETRFNIWADNGDKDDTCFGFLLELQ